MPNDEGNMILLKENKTTCYIDVLYFDGKSEPKQVRRISFFNEPPVPADWIARYDQDMFPDIASCES